MLPVLLRALHQQQLKACHQQIMLYSLKTLSIDSKPFNQHTFTVNMTVNEGEGQGVASAALNVTSKTTNDNALPANVIEGGAAVTTVSAISEVITIADFTAATSAAHTQLLLAVQTTQLVQ